MAVMGTRPALAEHFGLFYCAYYVSGTVCVTRSSDNFATLRPWGAVTSATVTTGADDATPGLLKYASSGRALLCVVPKAGVHTTFISRNDGETWSQVS